MNRPEAPLESAIEQLGRKDPVAALMDALAALSLCPIDKGALEIAVKASLAAKRTQQALELCGDLVKAAPDRASAHRLMAEALCAAGHWKFALLSLDRALAIDGGCAATYRQMGDVFTDHSEFEQALAHYERAYALDSQLDYVCGGMLHAKLHLCDWRSLDELILQARNGVVEGRKVIVPLAALMVFDDSDLQARAAEIYKQDRHPLVDSTHLPLRRTPAGKRRIGYFSGDFHDHALMHVLAEFFERHDREKHEIIAFSFGPARDDGMRRRVLSCFDEFLDVRELSDREVVQLARSKDLDVAVDLCGYTGAYRADIFQFRVAPLQVAFQGFTGTTFLDNIDYVIADRVVVPPQEAAHYSEKIAYLEGCYITRDTVVKPDFRNVLRASYGLPESAFVYCCFNGLFKITPAVFACWLAVLDTVEDSVLWLSDGPTVAKVNLMDCACRAGIDADRIRFAARVPYPIHLARIALADLSLDTLPYNAHTTATDALFAGVPHLTCAGTSFVARVGASLLASLGLHELISDNLQQYTATAIELGGDRGRIARIRAQINSLIASGALFDPRRHAENFERVLNSLLDCKQ